MSTPSHAGLRAVTSVFHVHGRARSGRWSLPIWLTLAFVLLFQAGAAQAQYQPNCTASSLHDAVRDANNAGGGTVTLVAGCRYDFGTPSPHGSGSALPRITTPITLVGSGGSSIWRIGSGRFRFFFVEPSGNLTLRNITLAEGWMPNGGNGSAGDLFNSAGTGGNGEGGGAIFTRGTVLLDGVLIAASRAGDGGTGGECWTGLPTRGGGYGGHGGNGGAIFNDGGDLTLRNSILRFNQAGLGGRGGSCNGGTRTRGGDGNGGGDGGAIYSVNRGGVTAKVRIERSTIYKNEARNGGEAGMGPAPADGSDPQTGAGGPGGSGGGVYSHGELTILDSTIENNLAGNGGQAIFNVTGSTSPGGNGGWGGGVNADQGTLLVQRTTFSSNRGGAGNSGGSYGAPGGGGGIATSVSALIESSTFANNVAGDDACGRGSDGGAIHVRPNATLTARNISMLGNIPGARRNANGCPGPHGTIGGIAATQSTVRLANGAFSSPFWAAGNRSPYLCGGDGTFIDDAPGHTSAYGEFVHSPLGCPASMGRINPDFTTLPASPADSGRDPALGPPTATPRNGSVLNSGNNASCVPFDTRNIARPQPVGGNCDQGAVEARIQIVQQTTPAIAAVTSPNRATFTVVIDADGLVPSVQWQVANGASTFVNVTGGTAGGPTLIEGTNRYTATYQTPPLSRVDRVNRYRAVVTSTAIPAPGVASDPGTILLTYGPDLITDLPSTMIGNVNEMSYLPIEWAGYPTVGAVDVMVSRDDGATWERFYYGAGPDGGTGAIARYPVLGTQQMYAATQSGHSWRFRVRFGGYPGGTVKYSNTTRLDVRNDPIPPSMDPPWAFQDVREGNYAIYAAIVHGNPRPTVGWQMSSNDGQTWGNLFNSPDGYQFGTEPSLDNQINLFFVPWAYHDGLRFRPVLNGTLFGPSATLRVKLPTTTTVVCDAQAVIGQNFTCTASVAATAQQGPRNRPVSGTVRFSADSPNGFPPLGQCTLNAQGQCSISIPAEYPGSRQVHASYPGPVADGEDLALRDEPSNGYATVAMGTCFNPVLTCPAVVTAEGDPSSCDAQVGDLRSQVQATAQGCTPFVLHQPNSFERRRVGDHPITFTAGTDAGQVTCSATLNVRDNSTGSIQLFGAAEEDLECGLALQDFGARITQQCSSRNIAADAPLPAHQTGDFTLTYTGDFGAAGSNSVTRLVRVRDTLRPDIALTGPAEMVIDIGSSFVDPGAVGHDLCKGDFPATASGADFDTSQMGTYQVTYTATDDSGNSVTTNRRVHVRDISQPTVASVTASNASAQSQQLTDGSGLGFAPNRLDIVYSEPMNGGIMMTSARYVLLGTGPTEGFETPLDSCNVHPNDQQIGMGITSYDGQDFQRFSLGITQAMPEGAYRLLICGARDNGGNYVLGAGGPGSMDPFVLNFHYDTRAPRVVEVFDLATVGNAPVRLAQPPPNKLSLHIDELLRDPPGHTQANDASNPRSYRLLRLADNGPAAPASCLVPPNPGDTPIVIDSVAISDPGNRQSVVELAFNAGQPLGDGYYRLFVCGATGPRDLGGNGIDGDGNGSGGDDFRRDFIVDTQPPANAAVSVSPQEVNVWSNTGTLAISWPAADDNGGIGIAGYDLRVAPDPDLIFSPGPAIQAQAFNEHTRSVPDGDVYVYLASCDWAMHCSAFTRTGPFRVDTHAPVGPSQVGSTTHAIGTWSGERQLTMSWSGDAADMSGGSGVAGYAYTFDTNPASPVPALIQQSVNGPRFASFTADEGTYFFHLRTCDQAGNCSPEQHFGPYRIDATPPDAVTATSPDHSTTAYSNDTHLTLLWPPASDAGAGLEGYSFVIDTEPLTEPDGSIELAAPVTSTIATLPGDGSYYFHLRSCDRAGNCGAATHTGPFRIDTAAPTNATPASASHTASQWSATAQASMSWSGAADTGSGIAGYSWLFDTAPTTTPDATLEVLEPAAAAASASLADGTHYFHVRTCDKAGNCSAAAHFGPIRIDTTAPVLAAPTSTHPTGSFSADPQVNVAWAAATDAGSGIGGYSWLFDSQPATVPDTATEPAGPNSAATSFADGNAYHFHLRACDAVGNCSTAAHLGPFQIDTSAPVGLTLSSSSHTSASWSRVADLVVNWSGASDAGAGLGGYSIVFDQLAGTVPDSSIESPEAAAHTATAQLADGADHYVHLRACDTLGNCGSTQHLGPFRIDTVAPVNPALASAHAIAQWSTESEVSVTWSGASDAGSGIAGYSWLFDAAADTTPDTDIDAGTAAADADLADGRHYFHLRSCDSAGNCSAAVHLGPFQIDTSAPTQPAATASHTVSAWSRVKSLALQWTAASDGDGAGLGGYSFVFDRQPGTEPDTTPELTAGDTPAASSERDDGNDHYFHLRACDTLGNCSAATHYGPFWIDTVLPANPALSSSSHKTGTWSRLAELQLRLTGAADAPGGSGVQGFALTLDHTATSDPGETITLTAGTSPQDITRTLADGDGHWVHLRSCDRAGNCAAPVHFGPLRVDATAPTPVTFYSSPSHVPGQVSGDAVIDIAWDGATDATSGLAGYRWNFDQNAGGSCDGGGSGDATVEQAASKTLSEASWYAHLCALDAAGNRSAVETLGPFPLDLTGPAVTAVAAVGRHEDSVLTDGERTEIGITQLEVRFSERLGPASLTTSGFQLYEAGPNGNLQTQSCGAAVGDDRRVSASGILQNAEPDSAALLLGRTALAAGSYRLLVCGTVTDAVGNPAAALRQDFHVVTTNFALNPNFDTDLQGWSPSLPAGASASLDTEDAGNAWSSGSALLADTAATASPWTMSQCVTLPQAPTGARIDVVRSGGTAAVDTWLEVVPFADSRCQLNPGNHYRSPVTALDTGIWTSLVIRIPDNLGTGYRSALLSFGVDAHGEFGVRMKFDNAALQVGGEGIFADGFERGKH